MNSSPTTPELSASVDHLRWFAAEVHPHDAQLKAYLRGSFPIVGDVEDLVQESYLRVWKTRLTQAIRSPKSFLFQIARHLAIDAVRRRNSSPIIPCPDLAALSVMEEGPGVAETVCTKEELVLLGHAIQALPPRCRAVIKLRQMQGLSQKEIAVQLGHSEMSVQKYVARGLERMEKFMRPRRAR